LIVIDHDDLIVGSSERDGSLLEVVLALRTFRVLEDLAQGRLADVEIGVSLEMPRLHFAICLECHGCVSSRVAPSAIVTSKWVTSPRTPAGIAMPVPSTGPSGVRAGTAQADQARIHPAIP
jgi:hypothetical protein